MSQFLLHIPTSNSPLFLSQSLKPIPKRTHLFIKACSRIPPRDRVIDFGKYKGRMLGSLPSTYLKWVSSNLRARDFEEWAKLADRVLDDAVYQDRIEWEFAQKILNGDVLSSPLSPSSSSGVPSLLEVSERFGWDNEDKVGWSRLNFELLGTSNGGRIPRIKDKEKRIVEKEDEEESDADVGERRGWRRERMKLKRRGVSRVGVEREEMMKKEPELKRSDDRRVENVKFPGREGLMRRVMDAKGRRPSF